MGETSGKFGEALCGREYISQGHNRRNGQGAELPDHVRRDFVLTHINEQIEDHVVEDS